MAQNSHQQAKSRVRVNEPIKPFKPTTASSTSIHVFESLLGFLGGLELDVRVALGQMRVNAVHGHVDHLDLAIGGEDLLDVFLHTAEKTVTALNFSKSKLTSHTFRISG